MDDESRASTSTPGGEGSMNESPVGEGGGLKGLSTSRKSHRKTRTGCRTCKRRKIKCDENRPCNNCVKHSVRCDFLDQRTSSDRPLVHLSSHASPSANGVPNSGNLPSFDRFAAEALGGLQPQPLQLQDLELLHHYSTHTAMTFQSDPATRTIFRVSIPQLGLKFAFVMRGVLAIAAHHLARFKHDQHEYYMSQAQYHQDIGLREASALIPNINEENCSAVYIFSTLTFFSSLAKPRRAGDLFVVGEEGIADWIFLMKGSSYIIQSSWEILRKGPFGPLFEAGQRRYDWRSTLAENHQSKNPLGDLRHLLKKNVQDADQLQIYEEALESLRLAFLMAEHSTGLEVGDVFVWIFQLSDGYLQLLRKRTPESLSILGYFCILLKLLDHFWWIEGWSHHLISRIYHILDEEHRLWIRTPIESIGWIPG